MFAACSCCLLLWAINIYFLLIYVELTHIPSEERLAVVAAEWRRLKVTDAANVYREKAQSRKKLTEASKEDMGASEALSRSHYKKMTKLVGICWQSYLALVDCMYVMHTVGMGGLNL